MGWVKHSEDIGLPEYLRIGLPSHCPYCGTEKENYYNSENKCTGRRCPNRRCPGTLARKIAEMCAILKWEGIGDGIALKLVRQNNLQSHFEAVPYLWQKQDKPVISLTTLFRITFIEGIDNRWSTVCEPYGSVESVLKEYAGEYASVVYQNKDELLYGQQFFEIIKPEAQEYNTIISGNVMLSGTIRGFSDRNNFVYAINKAFKGLVDIRVVGKRKTNVMALIQEADSPNQGKAECAIENGIPILTPNEFRNMLIEQVKQKLQAMGSQ